MSYILDALRRADAQRDRDLTRGIHAQPAPLGGSTSSRERAPWLWMAAGLGAVLFAGLGWWLAHLDRPAKTSGGADVPVASVTPAAATTASPAPAPARPLPAPAASALPAPAMPEAAPSVRAAQARERMAKAAGESASAPRPRPPAVAPIEAPAVAAAPVPAAQSVGGTPQQVTAAAGLTVPPAPAAPAPASGWPPDAPRLALHGGVYSPNPAQRMLIVNGQVYNEGSEVVPGVVLEQVQARSAVLRWRGGRYVVGY